VRELKERKKREFFHIDPSDSEHIKWTIHLRILHIPQYDVMGGWLVCGSRQKGICVGKKHELWPHALYILKYQHYNMMYWYPIVTVSIAIY